MSEAIYDPNGLRDDVVNAISGEVTAAQSVFLGKVPDGFVGRLSAISYTLHVVVATVQASGAVRYFDPSGNQLYIYTPSGLQNSYSDNVAVTVTGYVGNNTDIFQFSSSNADGVLEQCNLVDQWLSAGCSWELSGFSFHNGETITNIVVGITIMQAVSSIFPDQQQIFGNKSELAYLLNTP